MAVSFTKDQQRAIDEYGSNIIVSAGAGSGKTAVLSERVLHFVKDKGFKLDEFLILTFTKLAAGEMKDRIRKKLEKNNLEESKNVDVSDICNFDSYSYGLLRKYHFLLGLSENVSIIDGDVMVIKKYDILDEIMTRKYQEDDPLFKDLIATYSFKDDNVIRTLILKLEAKASSSDDEKEYFDTFLAKFTGKKYTECIINELEKYVFSFIPKISELLYEIPNIPYQMKDKSKLLFSDCESSLNGLLNAKNYDDFMFCLQSISLPSANSEKLVSPEEKACLKNLKDYITKLKNKFKKYLSSKKELEEEIQKNEKFAPLLLELAMELNKKQLEYKYQMQVFEFNDIAKMVLKLIRDNESIRNSIKYKLKMIMIDEYQDTSSIQEAFIKEIENDNVYMVGDIKQSIYRFRKAESSIFQNKYNAYKEGNGGTAIDLNKNFRSRKEVLEDINLIFKDIMSEECGGANYKRDHIIEYGNLDYLKAGDVDHSCHSEVITYFDSTKKLTSSEKAEQEARIIAQDIIFKINNKYKVYQQCDNGSYTRDVKLSDFCILIDRGGAFNVYKKVFSEYKIPLFVEQDDDIKSNSLVLTIKNLIQMLICVKNKDYKSNDFLHAFLSLARSFIYQYTDEKIYEICKERAFYDDKIVIEIKNIYYKYETSSNYDLIFHTIMELGIYKKIIRLGDIDTNELYLDSFLNKFKSMSSLDYSIEDFVIYLEKINDFNVKFTISSQGTTQESVRLMNIHKSKGLEFPIVYFSGYNKDFNQQDVKEKNNISDKYGLIFESKVYDKEYPIYTLNKIYELKEDLSEKIRLFYVALTRAREKMIFVIPGDYKDVFLDESKSLLDIFSRFSDEETFEKREIDVSTLVNTLIERKEEKIKYENIKVKDLNIVVQEIETKKASKELKLGTSSKTLDYGTNLHFMMEVVDFVSKDTSFIKNEKMKEIVEKFLNSDLLINVENARSYKEYEFIDEINSTIGIIDLMLVYDDHIDIIDYKTKQIDDESYDKQLLVYKNYVANAFNKPVNTYLYSLIDGVYRKTK